jgi:UDPglucose 6-dehydrogenase
MKIGIVGVGMVGGTLQYGFERIGHDVVLVDKKWPQTRLEDLHGTELTFICVPTPCNDKGECDISAVYSVCEGLDRIKYQGVTVIKSTVTPGTTDDLAQAFCPEFLRERARYSDFVENHDVCIIGCRLDSQYELIKKAHGSLPKQFIRLLPLEAELAKYFVNVFNAMRITFANQFFDVCQAAGADYTAIKNAVVKRHSIGDYYLECNKHFREFGGNCLPKDTLAFAQYATSVGAKPTLFNMLMLLNQEQQLNKLEQKHDKVKAA